MSVLTKLFVVLLIICSLLLTAATVVFVNRTEDFHKAAVAAEEQMKSAQRRAEVAMADAGAARQREAEVATISNSKVSDALAKINQLGQEVSTRDAEINDLKAKLAVAQGNISEQAGALKTMGTNVGDVSNRNKALTDENDKLRLTNADLVGANTDFQKRLEEAEREMRFRGEQLNQARADLTKAMNFIRDKGLTLGQPPRTASVPDLKGYIQEVKTDQGRTFATVSLGAKEKVEKGMEFSVVDQNEGTFLGKFIVDSVNDETSFGRLEGPRVQNVRRDNWVLSRL